MDRLQRRLGILTHRRIVAGLAVLTALAVVAIAEGVFPYHTSNHDEAVYLQQAAMLLEGQLTLAPPVSESFRPWFFVADGNQLYPKYTPVAAAIFAVGGALGSYSIALGLVAGAVVGLVYGVVGEVFDRTTGVVATVLVVLSPLFLVDASVFLSYIPAFALNLCFGWAYLRADRTGEKRYAALAGGAVGLSFFARSYTAVLFATPFVVHACWTLRTLDRPVLVRQSLTAALGLAGVALTLGYNAVMTGDPLVFPYQAFAPLDGLGFGRREILGYERIYDLPLALEANARVLWQYLTEWSVAAPLGPLVAAAGLVTVLSRLRPDPDPRKLILAGLFVTIPLGNVYFWGSLNILGQLSDPTDGLISFLGPYYHVGLLLPTAAFAAVALVTAWRTGVPRYRSLGRQWRAVALALLLVSSGIGVTVTADAAVDPLSDNYEVTRQYEQAYAPFENRTFENALVFLPTPYGQWLNHPFQALRNDPDYDGNVVYAMEHRQFEVLDAFPNRTLYRYAYRGDWVPYSREAVKPRLQPVRVATGRRLDLSLSVGVPRYTEAVEVRVSSGSAGNSTSASMPPDGLDMHTSVANGTVRATSPAFGQNVTLPLTDAGTVKTTIFVDYGSLGGFEYVVRMPVDRTEDSYRALTPQLEVCRSPRLCGDEAAYVPGSHRTGVWMNATLANSTRSLSNHD